MSAYFDPGYFDPDDFAAPPVPATVSLAVVPTATVEVTVGPDA